MTLTPSRTAKGTPLLTTVMLLGLFAAIPIAIYILFTKWSGSPQRQIVGMIGLFCLLFFSFKREKCNLLFLAVLFFSQFNISLVSFPLAPPAVLQFYFTDVLITLFLFAVIEKEGHMRFDALSTLSLFFIIWQCISALFSAHTQRSILFIFFQVKNLIIYLAVYNLSFNEKLAQKVFKMIFLIVAIQGTIGIAEVIYGNSLGLNILGGQGSEKAFYVKGMLRAAGTLGASNALGGFLAGLIVFLLPFSLVHGGLFSFGGVAVGFIALILTLSRAAWISFGVGAVLGMLTLLRAKIIKPTRTLFIFCMSVAVFLSGAFAFYEKINQRFVDKQAQSSAAYRVDQFSKAWPAIQRHPIWGIGPGVSLYYGAWNDNREYVQDKLPDVSIITQPHNSFLQFWLEGGYPSGLLWAFIVLLVFNTALNVPQRIAADEKKKFLFQRSAALGGMALIFHTLFGPEINGLQFQAVFWIFMALARNRTWQKEENFNPMRQKPI